MKLLVAGGAGPADPGFVYRCLDRAHAKREVVLLVASGASGVDLLAHSWAAERGVCRLPLRRTETPSDVLSMIGPDGLVAFPGAPAALVAACRAAGLPVWEPAPAGAVPLIPASP